MREQTKEQRDRITDIFRVFNTEFDVWKPLYDDIEKGYNWLAGKQYEPEEINWYRAQRRPTNVFNMIFPHVNTILGDLFENDKKSKVFPYLNSPPEIAAIYEDLLDSINFDPQNDVERAMAETFLASLVRVGWIYPQYTSDGSNLEGYIKHENVDEFEIMYDSRAKSYYLDDASYLIRSRWMTTDEIINTWRNKKRDLSQILMDRNQSVFWEGQDELMYAMQHHKDFAHESKGQYRVIEFHEMRYELTEVAYNPITRDVVIWDVDGDKADQFLQKNPNYKIIEAYDRVKYITECIPGLAYELDHRKAQLQDKSFDYIPLFAYKYGKKTIDSFGIFQNSFGPQKEFNEWHNRTADIINKSANPGQIWRPDLVNNPRDVRDYTGMTGKSIEVKPEAQDLNQAWRRVDPPTFPQGTDIMQREAMELLPKILGITPNQMGFSESKQEPAELFARRVKQAVKALAVIFKNISSTKKRRDDKTIRLMQKYYTKERTVQILVKEEMTPRQIIINQEVGDRVVNDITVGRYYTIVDDMDNNPTARMARFEMKTQLVKLILESFGPTAIDPDWWLQEADLGDVRILVDRINQAIGAMAQTGQEQEAMQAANTIIDMANKRTAGHGQPSAGTANKQQTASTRK